MDCGTASNNTRRYVDVTDITSVIGEDLASALPGYHSFTVSDFTASFAKQGKVKPFDIVCNSAEFQSCLRSLGESLSVINELFSTLATFVRTMYGQSSCATVTHARFNMFKKMCAPDENQRTLAKLRSVDPTNLPPSKAALREKVKRSNAVAWIWKKS